MTKQDSSSDTCAASTLERSAGLVTRAGRAEKPTVGVTGSAGTWRGVVRIGKRVVWQCDHCHSARDHSGATFRSARKCAGDVLRLALTDDAQIERSRQWYCNQSNGVARPGDYQRWEADVKRALALRAILAPTPVTSSKSN